MGAQYITLYRSKEVAGSTEEANTYTPPTGAKITVVEFEGDAAFTSNSVVSILWDYNTANEEPVWTIKGSRITKQKFTTDGAGNALTGDGTKKIAICLSNGEAGSLYMSGYAKLLVET